MSFELKVFGIKNNPFFCSWSGGKDSCLALYYAIENGGIPKYLLTMMDETEQYSHSHHIPKKLLESQARRLKIPIIFKSCSWQTYEQTFLTALMELKEKGIKIGVFGDIDFEQNRQWGIDICNKIGILPYHPLWKRKRLDLLNEFITLQFHAIIVVTNAKYLGIEWLGRNLDVNFIKEIGATGIDISGELGEYHTIVINGPLFHSKIDIQIQDKVFHDGYWFLVFK